MHQLEAVNSSLYWESLIVSNYYRDEFRSGLNTNHNEEVEQLIIRVGVQTLQQVLHLRL